MKVLFVYTVDDIQSIQHPIDSWSSIQFGISYISSFLKKHGHKTKLLVLGGNSSWKTNVKLAESIIDEFNPELICYTATFSQYAFIERVAEFIKNRFEGKFHLIGGVHASLNPDAVINGPFDALCIGEGEFPTQELCARLEKGAFPSGIANLWIKSKNGQIEKNDTADFIQDLNIFPFPDREMWIPWIIEREDDELAVLLGRGCPYDCAYCSNHALRRISHGKYVRIRSIDNILGEISELCENYPQRKIYLEVETITANKKWTLEFCSKLKAFNCSIGSNISYGCNFRISRYSIDESLFIAFKEANINKINIGLESGSEKIRRDILKRSYSNQDFFDTVAMARKYGIKYYIYNMIGVPFESLNDHMETMSLNRQCQPAGHYTGIFVPYPGTQLYDLCVKEGLLKNVLDFGVERNKACLDMPMFSKRQIQHCLTWFNYRVYRGYQPLWKLYMSVIRVKIKTSPKITFLARRILQIVKRYFVVVLFLKIGSVGV